MRLDFFRNGVSNRHLEIMIEAIEEYIENKKHTKNDSYEASEILKSLRYSKTLRDQKIDCDRNRNRRYSSRI